MILEPLCQSGMHHKIATETGLDTMLFVQYKDIGRCSGLTIDRLMA